MWHFRTGAALQAIVRFAFVLALGAMTGGCFQPLYGNNSQTIGSDDTVRDKLSSVDIPEIKTVNPPDGRLAVAIRNALLYDFDGGQAPTSPTYSLVIVLGSARTTVITDVASGRPDAQVEMINATMTLTEIATKKVVLQTSTFARASLDIPGSAQRFAQARAARNAEDRAVDVLAENIRNRLASYFVAGT
jgi:LPS-assembly lipoprotein